MAARKVAVIAALASAFVVALCFLALQEDDHDISLLQTAPQTQLPMWKVEGTLNPMEDQPVEQHPPPPEPEEPEQPEPAKPAEWVPPPKPWEPLGECPTLHWCLAVNRRNSAAWGSCQALAKRKTLV